MTTIKAAVEDLFNNRQLSAEEALDRHFAPSFRQRTNGGWEDRPAVLARVAGLREIVDRVDVTVLDELAHGDRYAERHQVMLVQRDGARVAQEVYVFAQRDADGRFVVIEESTMPLETNGPDAP